MIEKLVIPQRDVRSPQIQQLQVFLLGKGNDINIGLTGIIQPGLYLIGKGRRLLLTTAT